MPSYSRRRTRDQLLEDDDNSEIDTPDLSDDSDNTQHKRPRLGSRANRLAMNGSGLTSTANGASALDNFSPGSIIRVTMNNFVTYEDIEFYPGPNLNMVIGPNGTGKSSLVCAICLGLGWGPNQLGRAGSIKEFVRHGKDIATIEIELKKRPEDRLNYIIRTQIRREQNNQKWWLNGKETTHKKIKELMVRLKIQVDNLCQFLPQDRVVEFAQCTPVKLLHETLRAAAPEAMLKQQARLKELHEDRREIAATTGADQDQLKNLETRQQGLQADVDRIREREEIQANIVKLNLAHLMSRYEEAKEAFNEAKKQLKEGEKNQKKMEEECGPSLKAIKAQQAYHHKVRSLEPVKATALKEAQAETQRLSEEANDAAVHLKDIEASIKAEQTSLEKKKKERAETVTLMGRIKGDLNSQPPEFSGAEWNQKIREQEHLKRELESDEREMLTQKSSLKARAHSKKEEIRRLEHNLRSLESEEGRQLRYMERIEPETAKAWAWIQENQDKFEKQIYPPPMISCSVKDERYSDQIQALLNRADFTCFMAQTPNDAKVLGDQLYRAMSLSVTVRTSTRSLDEFRPPVSREEARQLGLDGFLPDFIEGPEPILAMLCSMSFIHNAGVALNEHNDAQYERLLNSGTVNSWVAGRTVYNVRRRREYGPQAMSTITRTINPGRYWTDQPVDSSEKSEFNRRLAEVSYEFEEMKKEDQQLKMRLEEVAGQMNELEGKIEEIKTRKSELQREFTRWQMLPGKLTAAQQKDEQLKGKIVEIRAKQRELQDDKTRAAIARARLVIAHATSLQHIAEAHHEVLENRLWQAEAESDIIGLEERNSGIMERIEEQKEQLRAFGKERTDKKEEGRRIFAECQEKMANFDDAYRAEITKIASESSAEDLHNAKDAEEAKLELIHAANPNVVREFERRAADMERIQRKVAASEAKLNALTDEIGEVMGVWEPRLEALVREINNAFAYNFEQISCSGEVHVHKEDDFDNWAIDIMVKFRESEELQQLNAHRQSGGERAVSTIFYLMALQSMAQSPFRVVDEINQGMDPRNERMVHERMVEIACREHTSQYFLITPKLLTGLRYDEKMRVLCIASGEHMPKEGRKLDFNKCLKIQKGLMAGA